MSKINSYGIREAAATRGGATEVWRVRELAGWEFGDGARAIETNGDPIFSDDPLGDPDIFAAAWDRRSIHEEL